MLIEETPLKHWIDCFYGYGSWNAPFWFISYEEGGGDLPEEVAERINYFQKVHVQTQGPALCDIRELYREVAIRWEGPKAGTYANRYEYRFGTHAVQNTVWKNLIAFESGYGVKIDDPLSVQKYTFASPSGQEALIQLYPLPSPHNHGWYYSWLELSNLSFLKSRALYEGHIYQQRIHNILSSIGAHKPNLVLMYGMADINTLKKSVQEFFPETQFKMIKATKREIPQHHRANINGTTLLITTQIPALRHNRVESGFDWEAFGKKVKSET